MCPMRTNIHQYQQVLYLFSTEHFSKANQINKAYILKLSW